MVCVSPPRRLNFFLHYFHIIFLCRLLFCLPLIMCAVCHPAADGSRSLSRSHPMAARRRLLFPPTGRQMYLRNRLTAAFCAAESPNRWSLAATASPSHCVPLVVVGLMSRRALQPRTSRVRTFSGPETTSDQKRTAAKSAAGGSALPFVLPSPTSCQERDEELKVASR